MRLDYHDEEAKDFLLDDSGLHSDNKNFHYDPEDNSCDISFKSNEDRHIMSERLGQQASDSCEISFSSNEDFHNLSE